MATRPPLPLLLLLCCCCCCCWLLGAAQATASLENRNLRVVTVLQEPFVMRTAGAEPASFEGFYVDLLKLLQRELKFQYQIYEVADKNFGGRTPQGGWDGLMGDIVNRTADLTLATLRMMPARLEAVDFTLPVSTSGLSLLYRQPAKQAASPAILAQPFAASTWLLLLLMYIIYTVLAFVIFLLSPYELRSGGGDSAVATKARKAGCGAFAFITGGLFIQGFSRTPKAPSARILAFAWWLFALATACCYTAGLVPRLLVGQPAAAAKFGNLLDLVGQTAEPFVVLKGGSTESMLAISNVAEFRAVHAFLSRNPQHNSNSTGEALDRVKKGDYVWISEGISADYYALTECDLVSVPTGLSTVDIGLAVAKGSDIKQALDVAILKVKANGELDSMKSRWWRKNPDQCDSGNGNSPRTLSPGDLLGLYLVLLAGAVAAFVALRVEFRLRAAGLPSCGGGQAEPPSETSMAKVGGDAGAAGASVEKQAESPESKPLV